MIGEVALLVLEYDQAIAWFTGALGFELIEDTDRLSTSPGELPSSARRSRLDEERPGRVPRASLRRLPR